MKIVKRIVLGLALAGALAAQTAAVAPPAQVVPDVPRQQRIFMLKYADARRVADVLAVFGYGIRSDSEMHAVAVSAPPDAMAAVEDAVKRLDVPAAAPKDVDLVVYMVVASEQVSAGAALPPELQPVADELKKIFSYKSFHLLDSILLRTQPGDRARTSGVVPNGAYSFEVQPTSVTEDPKGRLIRLIDLTLNISMPEGRHAGIQTEITVREGQRVVVGKSNMGGDQSLVLVVTAKVTE
jgi:hypothetical protein